MKGKSPLSLYILLALLTGCALIALLTDSLVTSKLFQDPVILWKRLIWPLIRLTVFISIGLFVAQVIEGMGWTNRLAVMARPFMRWGRLPERIGAVFTTAFFSGTTSLSMLMSFHKDGTVNRREVTIAVLLNTFPTFFLHLPTTFFIILPLVGKAGLVYLLLTFGAALLRLIAVLTYTHFHLPESGGDYPMKEKNEKNRKGLLRDTVRKFKSRLTRMIMIILPVYMIILLISDMGFFLWLRKILAQGINVTFIPVEAMSVVIFSLVAEFTSGYAAAGAMLESGALTVFQTVLALLIGNIIAAPVRALRHQMPYYMGIFEPKMGARLVVMGQSFRVASLVISGIAFTLIAMSLA
jgi:hypothetical protein